VPRASRSARVISVSSVALIVYVTLFPFDFVDSGTSLGAAARDLSLAVNQQWVLDDVPRNLVLFVPFGFGLAGLVATRVREGWLVAAIVTAAGLVLSGTIELLQTSTLLRFPSLADILANGAGTALGWGLFHMAGGGIPDAIASLTRRLRRALTRRHRLLLALTPTLALLLVTFASRHTTELSNWDTSFPLVIGNEHTGDRAWSGSLASLYLADRAFTTDEVARILGGVPAGSIDADASVLDYDFAERRDTPSGLVPRGTRRVTYGEHGVDLGPTRWLESAGPVTGASRALAASGQFTLSVEAMTSDTDQEGPARLLSISPDAFDRNLTIGQEGTDLVVRLRTPFTGPNGRSPEFIVPKVFTDVEPHRLVLTYNGSTLRLTVDDATTTHELELMPAVAVLMTLFPNDVGQMRVTDWGPVLLRGFYRAIMFVPWGAWLAADRRAWAPGAPSAVRAATRSLLLVVPALAAEGVLSNLISGYSFEPGLVLLGVSITVLGYVGVRLLSRES
jgi:hypothetical protein